MFSTLSKREISILAELNLSSTNAFNLVRAQILLFGQGLSYKTLALYHTILNLMTLQKKNMETLWEMKKMLVTCIFFNPPQAAIFREM